MNSFNKDFESCISRLNDDLAQIRSGRASSELLDSVKVEAYDFQNPIKNVATITVADAQTLVIDPWDKNIIDSIAKSLSSSNMGFSVSVDANIVRVKLPQLTEERRKEFVKLMGEKVEDARVAVRGVRQQAMKEVEEEVESGLSEDVGERYKKQIEEKVQKMNDSIEEIRESKEKELMQV